ncbi:MAG: hypothetical protein HYY84_11515 [Deltaproteobacteria bacterium]|nr:hypothetical protein [Deltaproteobacteria bacterium]
MTFARNRVAAFGAGILFAVLQFGFFFFVQAEVSATVVSYFSVTAAWLVGLIAGLWIANDRLLKLAPFAALAAFYAVWLLTHLLTFSAAAIPVIALFVAAGGAYAGVFFQQMATRAPDVRLVLLDENNGFVIGIVVALAGFATFGFFFFAVAPPVIAAGLVALRPRAVAP